MKRLLPLLLFFFITPFAYGQITLTADDYQYLMGEQHTSSSYSAVAGSESQFEALVGMDGGNRTYDFTIVSYDAPVVAGATRVDGCSNDIPGCSDDWLNQADVIWKSVTEDEGIDIEAWSFAKLQSDGFYGLGGSGYVDLDESTPELEEMIIRYEPACLYQKLPATMGTTWESDCTWTADYGEFSMTTRYEDTYVVDGWGTLVTPAGSAPALRIYNVSKYTSTFGGNNIVTTTYNYSFQTKGGLGANITVDEDGNIIDASYSVMTGDGIGTDAEDVDVPEQVALDQNYPNPFNPSTQINFNLAQSGEVKLAVFDITGREVAVLIDGVRPAGENSVTFSAGNLPSGMYLYRLTSAGQSVTRRMTLLK